MQKLPQLQKLVKQAEEEIMLDKLFYNQSQEQKEDLKDEQGMGQIKKEQFSNQFGKESFHQTIGDFSGNNLHLQNQPSSEIHSFIKALFNDSIDSSDQLQLNDKNNGGMSSLLGNFIQQGLQIIQNKDKSTTDSGEDLNNTLPYGKTDFSKDSVKPIKEIIETFGQLPQNKPQQAYGSSHYELGSSMSQKDARFNATMKSAPEDFKSFLDSSLKKAFAQKLVEDRTSQVYQKGDKNHPQIIQQLFQLINEGDIEKDVQFGFKFPDKKGNIIHRTLPFAQKEVQDPLQIITFFSKVDSVIQENMKLNNNLNELELEVHEIDDDGTLIPYEFSNEINSETDQQQIKADIEYVGTNVYDQDRHHLKLDHNSNIDVMLNNAISDLSDTKPYKAFKQVFQESKSSIDDENQNDEQIEQFIENLQDVLNDMVLTQEEEVTILPNLNNSLYGVAKTLNNQNLDLQYKYDIIKWLAESDNSEQIPWTWPLSKRFEQLVQRKPEVNSLRNLFPIERQEQFLPSLDITETPDFLYQYETKLKKFESLKDILQRYFGSKDRVDYIIYEMDKIGNKLLRLNKDDLPF